jgi:hypothetical protein
MTMPKPTISMKTVRSKIGSGDKSLLPDLCKRLDFIQRGARVAICSQLLEQLALMCSSLWQPPTAQYSWRSWAAFFRRAARVLVAAFSDFDLACVWLPAGWLDG